MAIFLIKVDCDAGANQDHDHDFRLSSRHGFSIFDATNQIYRISYQVAGSQSISNPAAQGGAFKGNEPLLIRLVNSDLTSLIGTKRTIIHHSHISN